MKERRWAASEPNLFLLIVFSLRRVTRREFRRGFERLRQARTALRSGLERLRQARTALWSGLESLRQARTALWSDSIWSVTETEEASYQIRGQ